MGGRNGGFVCRSHRGGTLRVLRPAKYDKSSSLTRVEPPRWFTARRKLVKFKSAFKTGLARCPAPPCSRYCQREIPPGSDKSLSLYHSWEASDGFPSSTHFFRQRLKSSLLSSSPCRPSVPSVCVLFPRHENSSNRLGIKSSRRSSVKIPGETSSTMLPLDRTLLAPH
ncbi:hypothetical protein ALC62_13237 [Cyphomyrmex costatus]|uniref:Uncharacterized protein n=1 Tax=Cyphomyrmex costatus TaxID=456900 RepID=A0A195C6C5_9HYME|nr:hypothetical protein ALC62_13237 [Cyphomyrmex costatus]